jgi:hypothetical protein
MSLLRNPIPRILLGLPLLAVCLTQARAGVITSTIGEFDGNPPANPTYPLPSVTIGSFSYSPIVGTITSATVSGFFGTVFSPSTALENLFVGGIQVATCASEAADCWNAPLGVQTPWSYIFTPAQLAMLQSGSVPYTVIQTGDFQVESGVTTLTVNYTTAAPEPESVALVGAALCVLLCVRRKGRA